VRRNILVTTVRRNYIKKYGDYPYIKKLFEFGLDVFVKVYSINYFLNVKNIELHKLFFYIVL